MARRAAEGSVKSPVNIVVGILLKRLRERSEKRLDQIASAFNVSPAYLAAIEAGSNAVSAKSVAGFGSLGLDFVAASALLTLVSYLDCRMKNSRIYDFREVQLRAEGLLSQTGALAFKPFLEWTAARIQLNETGTPLDSQQGLELLELSLQTLSQLKPLEPTTGNALPSRHKLSPMVEDLLDVASSGLSLLTPHISRFNFKAWEELNADRILEVRAYINDAKRFLADAPDFDWHVILLNPHRPALSIFLPSRTPLSEPEITEKFQEQIPLYNRSQSEVEGIKKQIRFFKVKPKEFENNIHRSLIYDFSQSQIIKQEPWNTLGKILVNQRRFFKYDNVWLYKLRDYGRHHSYVSNMVGILGAYDHDDLSSFGVFLDRADTHSWWDITNNIINEYMPHK